MKNIFFLTILLITIACQKKETSEKATFVKDPHSFSNPNQAVAKHLDLDIKVDFDTHDVFVDGSPEKLTQLEIDLLRYFAANPGRVLSRDELLEKVWKLRNYSNTRTVDNFISRLRRRFEEDAQNPVYFVSVRGAGYKFLPNG